jgi:hypothetical protein
MPAPGRIDGVIHGLCAQQIGPPARDQVKRTPEAPLCAKVGATSLPHDRNYEAETRYRFHVLGVRKQSACERISIDWGPAA